MPWGGRRRILTFTPLYQLMAAYVFYATLFLVILFDTFIFHLRVIGRGNLARIPRQGAFLISNHSLYFDPGVVAHAIAPRRTLFSALESTVQATPFLGNFIRFLGAFPIPEQMSLVRLVHPVRDALDRGWLVHFFPERDLKFQNRDLQPFHPGVFFLAHLLDVPVVPVTLAIRHPRLFGRRVARAYVRVTAVIGEPIHPRRFLAPGLGKREALERMASHARLIMQRCLWQYGDAAADGLAETEPAEAEPAEGLA
jgi:1-acyl-sn-glycerol-3-phosphate acyltransferase